MSPRPRPAALRARRLLGIVWLVASLAGCQAPPRPAPSFAQRIAAAHGVEDWNAEQALQGELLARFEDGEVIDLRFVLEIDGPRVRIAVGDGTPEAKPAILVYDGENLGVSPDTPAPEAPRMIVEKWPALITLPFRLASPMLRIERMEARRLGSSTYDVAKVTFPGPIAGLGEWLLVYTDPESRLLKAVVYSVDDEPRAITFYAFDDVSGVKLPTEWKLWHWTEAAGIYDKPTGTGRLFNLGFTTVGALRGSRSDRPE